MPLTIREKKIAKELRQVFPPSLPLQFHFRRRVTDREILAKIKDSYLRARIECRLAWEDFIGEIKKYAEEIKECF